MKSTERVMTEQLKIVLFSEVNSKLGSPFLRILSAHPMIQLAAIVTSPEDMVCSYFVQDENQVNLQVEAGALGIPVLRPARVSSADIVDALAALDSDYFFVANFQQQLSSELLAIPRIAAINFHPAPLPRYAGLAPFFWMVRHGERHGAISVIKMDEGLDTGPIIMQRQLRLSGHETSIDLRTFQEQQNVLLLLDLLPTLANGAFTCIPQDLSRRSYYGRPKETDYLLNFTLNAATVHRYVLAGYRHPGAHFFLPDGTRIVVLSMMLRHDLDMGTPDYPGCIVQTGTEIFIAAADAWLQLLTIEVNGVEKSVTSVACQFALHKLAR
ncbi:formyl transferase [Verminephrobacter aporrectodeae subsp. tuberculatae]|nr:formyl transferase [Verminephrobacter aporrectodeae subsp. tuberculatae]